MSRAAVVAGFLHSQESAELASESFYAAFLHRAKDQPGDDRWVGAMTAQSLNIGQVATDFLGASPMEFLSDAAHNVS
jgi:hypothetical protein